MTPTTDHLFITLTPALKDALESSGVVPTSYGPAYDGESVGLDLYNAGPDITIPSMGKVDTGFDDEDLTHAKSVYKVLVPSGVRIGLPLNTVALIRERGSITKTPLVSRAGVIDPGYTGEIFVNMINTAPTDWLIRAGEKLPVQLLVVPAYTAFKVVDVNTYTQITSQSNRGDAKIGSTN